MFCPLLESTSLRKVVTVYADVLLRMPGRGPECDGDPGFPYKARRELRLCVPSDVSLPNAMLRVASASMHEHSLFFLCWEKHAIVKNLLSVGHCYSASLMP